MVGSLVVQWHFGFLKEIFIYQLIGLELLISLVSYLNKVDKYFFSSKKTNIMLYLEKDHLHLPLFLLPNKISFI